MKKFLLSFVLVVMMTMLGLNFTAAQEATPDPMKAGWPETFIIGVYPGDNVEKAIAAQEPLRAYLEKTLGVRTVIITGTSYGAVIEAMRAGRADAFEVGPFSYVLAADVANAEAIAVGNYVTAINTEILPGYYSVMFTKKGSGIKSIDDLKGKTFAFTDPASTSGYLVPATDILNAENFDSKDQLEEFLGQATFAGNHPASVLAVNNGTTDAGATFDDNLVDQANADIAICGVEKGTEKGANIFHSAMTQEEIMKIYDACPEGNLTVFHQSPLIPQTPFAINKNLPQTFKDAVKSALLNIKDDQALVDELGRFYVDPTTINTELKSIDSMYDPLRVIAQKLDLDLKAR
ncbi:MAG: phosphate/phosphite/phosphonate ABC transporter substrate-binding protein [Anaerolineaceae bacterium]|nr:phosphate/phosphite/phosphonate ABC transporter substrate-binding protein [Anaerolineaceae bacterium]